MKKIRRIIIKEYNKDGGDMNYQLGQEVYAGHKIHQILESSNGCIDIYIIKGNEEKPWKSLTSGIESIKEYEIL